VIGWRSTTLGLAEKHCPRALDFYESGAPYDRDVFAVGVAAHAVLESIGLASVAAGRYLEPEEAEAASRAVCEDMIANGRDFEGEPEPPLPSAAVWAGRDLAIAFQREIPLPYDFKYEHGLAVNRDWQLCPYGPEAWLRARIDSHGTELASWMDEGDNWPTLVVDDYKSSWASDERELDSIQRKVQALLSWRAWGEGHEVLKLRIVNLRQRRTFETTILPNTPEGAAVMERWRLDVESEIKAREVQVGRDGRRPASPGARCLGCPYIAQCDAARETLPLLFSSDDPVQIATAYALAVAVVGRFKGPLKQATAEGPIEIDGALVGAVPKEIRILKPAAPEKLAALWAKKVNPPDLETALAALPGLFLTLGLGVEQAERLVAHAVQDKEARVRTLAPLLGTFVKRLFGVYKSSAPKSTAGDIAPENQ
jgi:hypothetical protein